MRAIDQRVQHRIVKHRPPRPVLRRFADHARVLVVDQVLRNRRGRAAVIGTHLETVVNVFVQAGAAASGQWNQQQGNKSSGTHPCASVRQTYWSAKTSSAVWQDRKSAVEGKTADVHE